MTIGGLTVGVTPLDMAHAYETIAHGGERMSGTMAQGGQPVGIQEVDRRLPAPPGRQPHRPQPRRAARRPAPGVAPTETRMLETVLQYGTGKRRRDRPVRRRQDGHHLQLRRRLVRRLGLQVHRRRVGGLSRKAGPHDHRLQRRPRPRRHLPRAHLAQLHDLRPADRHRPRSRTARTAAPPRPAAPAAPPKARVARQTTAGPAARARAPVRHRPRAASRSASPAPASAHRTHPGDPRTAAPPLRRRPTKRRARPAPTPAPAQQTPPSSSPPAGPQPAAPAPAA